MYIGINKIIGDNCAFVPHIKGGYVAIYRQANQYFFTESVNKGFIQTSPYHQSLESAIGAFRLSNNVKRYYKGTKKYEQERDCILSQITWEKDGSDNG